MHVPRPVPRYVPPWELRESRDSLRAPRPKAGARRERRAYTRGERGLICLSGGLQVHLCRPRRRTAATPSNLADLESGAWRSHIQMKRPREESHRAEACAPSNCKDDHAASSDSHAPAARRRRAPETRSAPTEAPVPAAALSEAGGGLLDSPRMPDAVLALVFEHLGAVEALCRARLWAVSRRLRALLERGAVEWGELQLSVVAAAPAAPLGPERSDRDLQLLARLAGRGLLRGLRALSVEIVLRSPPVVLRSPALAAAAHDTLHALLVLFSTTRGAAPPAPAPAPAAPAGLESVAVVARVELAAWQHGRFPATWLRLLLVGTLNMVGVAAGLRSLSFELSGLAAGQFIPLSSLVPPSILQRLISASPALQSLSLSRTLPATPGVLAVLGTAAPRLRDLSLHVTSAGPAPYPLQAFARLPSLRSLRLGLLTRAPLPVAPPPPPGLAALRSLSLSNGALLLPELRHLPGLEALEIELHAADVDAGPIAGLPRLRELTVALVNCGEALFASLAAALPACPALRALHVRLREARPGATGRGRTASGLAAVLARAGAPWLRSWEYCSSDGHHLARAPSAPLSLNEARALAACPRLERVALRHAFEFEPPPSLDAYAALGRLRGADFGARLRVIAPGPAGCEARLAAALGGVLPHALFVPERGPEPAPPGPPGPPGPGPRLAPINVDVGESSSSSDEESGEEDEGGGEDEGDGSGEEGGAPTSLPPPLDEDEGDGSGGGDGGASEAAAALHGPA
eukprot:tig00000459_g1098.t1